MEESLEELSAFVPFACFACFRYRRLNCGFRFVCFAGFAGKRLKIENADQLSINLARQVTDGEQIVVQAYIEAEPGNSESTGASDSGLPSSSNTEVLSSKVNINTASASELTTLDGIGESTAAKIIAYRQANGSFASIEDIKKVSGIGDRKYEAIKDRITV